MRLRLVWPCALVIVFGPVAFGQETPPPQAPPVPEGSAANARASDEDYEAVRTFIDSLDQIERNYVRQISRQELIDAAIEGMMRKLDPYTNYISQDRVSGFRREISQGYEGVGIRLDTQGGKLSVLSPLYRSPAYRAGIHAGEIIEAIDGTPVDGVSLTEAEQRLKGAVGTEVTMSLFDPVENARREVKLIREIIHMETVLGDHRRDNDAWEFMLDPETKIGYIHLTVFTRESVDDLKLALEELEQAGVRGLILDLRFNPGGMLTAAVEIADMFVSEGKIVQIRDRQNNEFVHEARKEGTHDGFAMAVLLNHYSASASELLAGCLQDHARAVIVGERSFGKGSVQNVVDLNEGRSALKITTAYFIRPNGKPINRKDDSTDADDWGVRPDDGLSLVLSDDETRSLLVHRFERDKLRRHTSQPSADAPPPAEGAPAPAEGAAPANPAEQPAPPADAANPQPGIAPEQVIKDQQLKLAIEFLQKKLAEQNPPAEAPATEAPAADAAAQSPAAESPPAEAPAGQAPAADAPPAESTSEESPADSPAEETGPGQ